MKLLLSLSLSLSLQWRDDDHDDGHGDICMRPPRAGAAARAARATEYHRDGAVPTDGNTNLNHQAQRQQQQPAFTTNQHHQHHQHQPAFTTANCNTSNTRLHTQHSTVHAARSTVASPVECEQHAAVAAPHYGGPCR
jgi:hypothetical protein